jgi:hypothetical protein
MVLLLALAACTEDTRGIRGVVADVWGKPVPDATVVVEGVMDRYYTDANGKFDLDIPVSKLVIHASDPEADDALEKAPGVRVLVGKDGFIKDMALARTVPDEEDFEAVSLALYPEPEEPGFYAVGRTGYVPLGHQRIQMVGTDLAHFAGVQDIPNETVAQGKVTLVFNTRLRTSEISQMNLHLSRMEFVSRGEVKGIFGPEQSLVNLWVAKEDHPFDLEGFDTREDYLITTREALAPGMYAFHAHDILHEEDDRVLRALPKEQLVAFTFEVR